MRKSILAGAAALSLLATGAVAESRNFELKPFNKVHVATGLNAVITKGATQSVRIETKRDGVLDQIEVDVRNGEFRAKRDTNLLDIILSGGILNMMHSDIDATIFITVPELTEVSASSGAAIETDFVEGNAVSLDVSSGASIRATGVAAGTLSLDASSGARIEVSGVCETADLDFSSGARISGEDMNCRDVNVSGSSGASGEIGAVGKVTGSVSSGASMRLDGTPASVNVESSSGGSVRIR